MASSSSSFSSKPFPAILIPSLRLIVCDKDDDNNDDVTCERRRCVQWSSSAPNNARSTKNQLAVYNSRICRCSVSFMRECGDRATPNSPPPPPKYFEFVVLGAVARALASPNYRVNLCVKLRRYGRCAR